MLLTIGHSKSVNRYNQLIINDLHTNTPPKKKLTYIHALPKLTTCEKRVSRGCFVLSQTPKLPQAEQIENYEKHENNTI